MLVGRTELRGTGGPGDPALTSPVGLPEPSLPLAALAVRRRRVRGRWGSRKPSYFHSRAPEVAERAPGCLSELCQGLGATSTSHIAMTSPLVVFESPPRPATCICLRVTCGIRVCPRRAPKTRPCGWAGVAACELRHLETQVIFREREREGEKHQSINQLLATQACVLTRNGTGAQPAEPHQPALEIHIIFT